MSDEDANSLPGEGGGTVLAPVVSDAKLQASLLKRSYAIAELLDTERSYINKLRGAVQNYLHPIMAGEVEGVVGGRDIREVAPIVFGNMEEILQFHEEVFLPALEGCDQSVDQIVDCFLRHYRQKHAFSMYTNYILGRSSADNWMPQAKVFFEARRRILGDKIELASYVIAPVQRFTKYKLLLRDIAKYTRNVGEDATKAEEAFQLMTTLPQEANDIVCTSMIKGLRHDLHGHGQLRHKGPLLFWDSAPSRRPLEVQVFLFDLRLIITEPQDESGFYPYKTDCILTHSVQVIEDLDKDPLQWSLAYQDVEGEKYFFFVSSSETNKEEWVQRVKKILQSLEALARGLGIRGAKHSDGKANGSHTQNCLLARQTSTLSNSSLEDLSSSDLDEDRPQATEYRPLPDKLRKSPKAVRPKERITVARGFLPLFPDCYEMEETLTQSYSPQSLHRDALASDCHSSPGLAPDSKKRSSLTPKALMRSILRASMNRKHFHKAVRVYSSADHGGRSLGRDEALVKSPSMFNSSRCHSRNDMTVSSSDEDDEAPSVGVQRSSPSRHVLVPGFHYQSTIYIGRDDIQEKEEKTHILTAHPGEVFEVRDRSSGSDFWYVRRLHGLGDGKREGWVKAKHLVPYHAPFMRCEAAELYKMQKEVGRGRFGCVKTCLSRQEPAQFVAKIVPKSETTFTRFAFELNAGYSLRHPNLVRVKEGIVEKANYIIIMERIPGAPLIPHILSRASFCEADAAHFTRQLCAALAYMHGRGLLHLDVRPGNILVHNNRVKLCDFGAARYPDMELMLAVAKAMLEPEQMYHMLYAAPELLSQSGKTDRTDMWGVGVVTYIMLFGAAPFQGAQAVHTVAQIMDAQPNLDGQLISAEAQDFLEQLLKRHPRDRMSADKALGSHWLTTRNIYIAAKLDTSRLKDLEQLSAASAPTACLSYANKR